MGSKFYSMKNSNQIILNGEIFTQENIYQLFLVNEPLDSWRNAIYDFLKHWFDDSDYITAHTSGSTGKPKEIRLAKQAMLNSARMTNEFFGLDNSNTALLCLPASYIAGKMMLVRALVGGFNLLTVEPKSNPFENIEIEIDFCAITPYQLIHSANCLKARKIKKIIVGGGAVNSKLEELASDIPAELYETYGMTETCSHIALRRFNGVDKSSFFSVLNDVAVRTDNRGCLVVNAPHLVNEEIITNDIVELIDEKAFCWLGRFDAVINSAGVKIHPEQVEKKLEGIINSNYFIASIPDLLLENKVVLIIESEQLSQVDETVLKDKIDILLTKYEVPKHLFYLPKFVYSDRNKLMKIQTLAIVMQLYKL